MPLVNDKGLPIADVWQTVGADEVVTGVRTILPLARFVAARGPAPELAGDEQARGVALASSDRLDALVPHLTMLDLVAIDFPKFRDGRGFTIARSLREHRGFDGEIRATGHLLPDQFSMLLECGFTTVQAPDDRPVARWSEILEIQPHGAAPARPVQLFRRLVPRAAEG